MCFTKFVQSDKNHGFKVFGIFSLIMAVLSAITAFFSLQSVIQSPFVQDLSKTMPEIIITNGVVTEPAETFWVSELSNQAFAVVIDTKVSQISKFPMMMGAVVTRDRMYSVVNGVGQEIVFTPSVNLIINRNFLDTLFSTTRTLFIVIAVVFSLIVTWVSFLLTWGFIYAMMWLIGRRVKATQASRAAIAGTIMLSLVWLGIMMWEFLEKVLSTQFFALVLLLLTVGLGMEILIRALKKTKK